MELIDYNDYIRISNIAKIYSANESELQYVFRQKKDFRFLHLICDLAKSEEMPILEVYRNYDRIVSRKQKELEHMHASVFNSQQLEKIV